MEGLFSRAELQTVARPVPALPQCGKCGLYKGCKSPKMSVAGRGRAGVLVVGEAPGRTEDEKGLPFQGDAGQLLQRAVRRAGLDLFEDCWVTNALACRPPDNKVTNEQSVEHCRPLVMRAIEELEPTVVLLLGKRAVRSVIGRLWREDVGAVERWAGFQIPARRWNCWVCPTWHPSHILRNRDDRGRSDDPVKEANFHDHVADALDLTERPWDPLPDYEGRVRVVVDPEYARAAIDGLVDRAVRDGRPIAFDFETTTLKPFGPHASVVCCSVSDGRESVAFLWHGNTVRHFAAILGDPEVAKVGWNVQMEAGWCQFLGIEVRGWAPLHADGMMNTRLLDSRTGGSDFDPDKKVAGITSLKFQTFVRLGVEDYAAAVSPYLKAPRGEGGNAENRVRELVKTPGGLNKLLVYCGYDSLYEAVINRQQVREMGL